jgi:octaprenyl-diphosphate synthase
MGQELNPQTAFKPTTPAALRALDKAPSIQPLHDLVAEDMAAVNALILESTHSDVALIPDLAQHLIDSGGKRIRPMLTLAAARLFGYGMAEGEDKHITLAAAVEFMHTATLLHDDVVDDSDMRRGKPAPRMIWGNEASVLVGDFLLGQAFRMMVGTGSLDALQVLSDASAVIAEGEVLQLVAARNLETDFDTYLKVIDSKTAALFLAAAEVGPIIAGQDMDARLALRKFGRCLGVAFQLIDDALDYSGDRAALGKNVGDDLREGKVTYPVMLAYERGDADQKAFWKRCIVTRDIHDGDIDQAITLIGQHNAHSDTAAMAASYADKAREALSRAPAGPLNDALVEAVDFAVARGT